MGMHRRVTQRLKRRPACEIAKPVTVPATYAALLHSLTGAGSAPFQRFVGQHGVVERSLDDARALAYERGSQLTSLGVEPGDRVGIVVTDPSEFLPLVQGCLLFGFVATPMYPPPPFSRLDTYRETLSAILKTADAKVVITDGGLAPRLGVTAPQRIVEVNDLPLAQECAPARVLPGHLALLQFTSGSTATPRGVEISHAALMANIRAFAVDGLHADTNDHGVSWLPLFHDMGLIGFGLAPALTRTAVTYIPTARFVRTPSIWLQCIAEQRATITFAPNFAYSLVTRRAMPNEWDLSCVRMWGCGAEPISSQVLDQFERKFAANGVRPGAVAPCYGLAEATLAVTFAPPGLPRVSHHLDPAEWEQSGRAHFVAQGGMEVVSCGVPLPGYAVAISGEQGRPVPDGTAGEIVVRGPSLGARYRGDSEESARVFREGALHTGDRGYLWEGQLFVTGRLKDTLVVNGRKYDPHVIEQCAEQLPSVRRAAAINLDLECGSVLVLMVETAQGGSESVEEAVRAQVAAHVGAPVYRVLCVGAATIPRTTSGKLRRGATRLLAQSLLVTSGTAQEEPPDKP
jgi:fatty-acyl-CoA synthase